jgi:hypothetical protein
MLKVGFDEAKESLGYALLPFVERFIGYLNQTGIPTLNAFIAGLTGDAGLTAALDESQKGAATFGSVIKTTAGIIAGFITFVKEAIGLLIEFANRAIQAINLIKPGVDIGYIPNPSALTGQAGGFLGNQSSRTLNPAGTPFGQAGGNTYNIAVSAIDSESAARAVAKVLNDSASRSVPQLYNSGIRGG